MKLYYVVLNRISDLAHDQDNTYDILCQIDGVQQFTRSKIGAERFAEKYTG